jgi:hypothetical protein
MTPGNQVPSEIEGLGYRDVVGAFPVARALWLSWSESDGWYLAGAARGQTTDRRS